MTHTVQFARYAKSAIYITIPRIPLNWPFLQYLLIYTTRKPKYFCHQHFTLHKVTFTSMLHLLLKLKSNFAKNAVNTFYAVFLISCRILAEWPLRNSVTASRSSRHQSKNRPIFLKTDPSSSQTIPCEWLFIHHESWVLWDGHSHAAKNMNGNKAELMTETNTSRH